MFLNKVILCGQVCNTPILRYTKNEVPVTNFIIKTIEKWKVGDDLPLKSNTKFHKIVCWGNIAKHATNILTKGSTALIEGELSYHKNIQKIENGDTTIPIEVVNTEIKATNIQVSRNYEKIEEE